MEGKQGEEAGESGIRGRGRESGMRDRGRGERHEG